MKTSNIRVSDSKSAKRSNYRPTLIGIVIGVISSVFIWWFSLSESEKGDHASKDQKQPLYWVAPMDDSYRRDKPGKSPMGMDLVPVYSTSGENSVASHSTGEVMISPAVQQNMGVKLAEVTIGRLQSRLSVTGSTFFDEDSIVHIHPRVEGWIDDLFIKSQGDSVEKGQPLYTLYSPELVSAQEQYLLAVKRRDKTLMEGAKARLISLGVTSSFIEKIRDQQRVFQTVTFSAPQSGVVEALSIREGFFVQPGNTLMSIANLQKVWVIADVPERYFERVKVGNKAQVSFAGTGTNTRLGQIDYIYPSLSLTTRSIKVRITLDNDRGALRPNMFADVALSLTESGLSLLVPKSAIIRTAAQNRVVISDGAEHFKSVAVVLGDSDDDFFEVLDGIMPNDKIVVSGQFLIDSESSKNSDFLRMQAPSNQASTYGEILAIDKGEQRLTIARGPIEKWGRGPATMTFDVSPHIDLSHYAVGDPITFTFITGDAFTVIDIKHKTSLSENDRQHPQGSSSTGHSKKHSHGEHMNHD
ncbi:efflux RND transporter periplasmic adaptor subunit [Alteromonas sp. V450]|uniref:efflux RND transporter periplasmic adaptor subunit n=1 Tax=Alteromonas sp. V450 TaxID=1912139 RepID=UPI0009FA0E60|nr:efflux RND transporter periplasmic adaptor subunit [Alteromonas sp. V450]